jgi:hypothetical protein
MDEADRRRLADSSRRLGSLTLGVHECEFCGAGARFEGNGEYRYYGRDGSVYAAPMMILHYVERHGYCPPAEFMNSLNGAGGLQWDRRAERLAEVLSGSEDLEMRCEAAIDLVQWDDPRVAEALVRAGRDEELIDVAGDEVGRSLGVLALRGSVNGLRYESLADIVRFGFDEIVGPATRSGSP